VGGGRLGKTEEGVRAREDERGKWGGKGKKNRKEGAKMR